MKKIRINLSVLFLVILFSCKENAKKYKHVIFKDHIIHKETIKNLHNSEKALLTMYLYAYANACDTTESPKCKILKLLNIENECDIKHINFLKKWFKNDYIFNLKLENCPVLASNSAIQNKFKEIIISRNIDTIFIQYQLLGMNNSQEKSWNINRRDTFLVKEKALIKM